MPSFHVSGIWWLTAKTYAGLLQHVHVRSLHVHHYHHHYDRGHPPETEAHEVHICIAFRIELRKYKCKNN